MLAQRIVSLSTLYDPSMSHYSLKAEDLEYFHKRRGLSCEQRWSTRPIFTFDDPHSCLHCQSLLIEDYYLETLHNLSQAIEAAKDGCELFIWLVDEVLEGNLQRLNEAQTFCLRGSSQNFYPGQRPMRGSSKTTYELMAVADDSTFPATFSNE